MGECGAIPVPQILTHGARHCADAVLSFSNEITLVAGIAAPLLDFVLMWVQSNSDYDFIIGQTFPPTWCSLCRPVLSLQATKSHWVYSAIDLLEPDGHPVISQNGCDHENLDPDTQSKKVRIKYLLCQSTCGVKVTEIDTQTPLGRKGIMKVLFPQTQAKTSWISPESLQGPSTDKQRKPPKKKPSQHQHSRGGAPVQRPRDDREPNTSSQLQAPPPPTSSTSSPNVVPTHHQHKWRRHGNDSFSPHS